MTTKDEVLNSLRTFKSRRDALLHEDAATFDHHARRFTEFCSGDKLLQGILAPLEDKYSSELQGWWTEATQRPPKLEFPPDANEELMLRFRLLKDAVSDPNRVLQLGIAHGQNKRDGWVEIFRTIIVRPLADELSHLIGEAADLATPEARAVQAVPFSRIPGKREARMFLSHKSADKPLVYRYFHALTTVGFDPWLDEPELAAGANLERELLRGFEESCAAVFFITDQFRDERYLAAEIDYAIMQKRKKGSKFAIVTLRYAPEASIPGLLAPYVYKDVVNDLEGFDIVVKALPIELGPVRWKAEVV